MSSRSCRAHSKANKVWAAVAVPGIIFGAAYLLWLYQRTMLGEVTNEKNKGLPDLNWREGSLCAADDLALTIGIYPKPYFDILENQFKRLCTAFIRRRTHKSQSSTRRQFNDEHLVHRHRSLRSASGHPAVAIRLRDVASSIS